MGGVIRIADIAPACAGVAGRASHVGINHDKIPAYARFIADAYPVTTELGADDHFISSDHEKAAAYVLALDSVNFGSGYFAIAKECGLALEYAVIARGLKKSFENGAFAVPEEWRRVTAKDFSRLLSVPQGRNPELDVLLENFASHLRATGEKIASEYDGKVLNLLAACGHSAVMLAETTGAWENFHDVHPYKGRDIPILKRAQILAADMHLALGGMRDVDKLTCFADNMVPHVLRCDGILEYTSDALIPSGSEKEVEIRAAAVHAVESMKAAAENALTSVNFDHMLWKRGYAPEIYGQKPHRTLSVWY
ncbi:MAG: hypothetical protein KGL10_03590 [Alphaproteobacteria bacterium]|nr:hypothetical protein [Alphaproteobacteria bacterium]MDE2336373.1 hypothetical protein [Alphaproteobacteria bacterium]